MTGTSLIDVLLKRDRLIVGGGLALVTTIAGLYTALGVGMEMSALEMTGLSDRQPGVTGIGGMVMQPAAWTPGYALLVFMMWWVMMIAMMTPSAAPMILLYGAVKRKSTPETKVIRLSAVFVLGYLLVWAVFSAIAAGLQWALELRGLVSPMLMELTGRALGGAVLLAAGIYQLTPLKQACLANCRSPVQFLTQHHRPGRGGALRLGMLHGAYCLGCCWALMALLFVGGIMNLYWIAGLALLVLAEKLLPAGDRIARIAGAVLVVAGGGVLIGAVVQV